MSFDLKKLSVDPEAQKEEMVLRHPGTDEPLTDEKGHPATLVLYGPDSSVMRGFQRTRLNKQTKRAAKKGDFSITAEELEKSRTDRCVTAIADWKNISFEGDEKCSEENKLKVLQAAPWLAEQIIDFIAERANFMNS